jgi:hypothetical protein
MGPTTHHLVPHPLETCYHPAVHEPQLSYQGYLPHLGNLLCKPSWFPVPPYVATCVGQFLTFMKTSGSGFEK